MKTVVLYSGGLDSTVVLAQEIASGNEVHAITLDYRQSCHPEIEKCQKLATLWGFRHRVVPFSMARTDARDEIPARNTLMLSVALEQALVLGATRVVYGAEPDSRYVDSSPEYIDAMKTVFHLHGIQFDAPVKQFANKTHVLMAALDLGVPLHLVHPSRGTEVHGACSSSSKFLNAVARLFPNANPVELLESLENLHDECGKNPFDLRAACVDSFKIFPALLVLAGLTPRELAELFPCDVYTTGNWGKAVPFAARMLGMDPTGFVIKQTTDVKKLGGQCLPTDSRLAQWGIKQALSRLPRPAYLRAAISCKRTQGHLAQALVDLGYNVQDIPKHNPELEVDESTPPAAPLIRLLS